MLPVGNYMRTENHCVLFDLQILSWDLPTILTPATQNQTPYLTPNHQNTVKPTSELACNHQKYSDPTSESKLTIKPKPKPTINQNPNPQSIETQTFRSATEGHEDALDFNLGGERDGLSAISFINFTMATVRDARERISEMERGERC